MKKIALTLAFSILPLSNVFAAGPTLFECQGSGIPATAFALSTDSGVMPLALVDNKLITVNYTTVNAQDVLQIAIATPAAATVRVQGPANSNVTYVDGGFWVTCNPK